MFATACEMAKADHNVVVLHGHVRCYRNGFISRFLGATWCWILFPLRFSGWQLTWSGTPRLTRQSERRLSPFRSLFKWIVSSAVTCDVTSRTIKGLHKRDSSLWRCASGLMWALRGPCMWILTCVWTVQHTATIVRNHCRKNDILLCQKQIGSFASHLFTVALPSHISFQQRQFVAS